MTLTMTEKGMKPQPVAPYLENPIAPFAGKSRREIASTAARYYGECALQGISPKDADNAAKESQTHFQNWWLQHRFKKADSIASEVNPKATKTKRRRSGDEMELKRSSRSKTSDADCDSMGTSTTISDDETMNESVSSSSMNGISDPMLSLEKCKCDLLQYLTDADGETTCPKFLQCLEELKHLYNITSQTPQTECTQPDLSLIEGVWMTMTKPNFPDCLGKNEDDEYLFSLGRMSFDMYRPTDLLCSLESQFNPVFEVDVTDDNVPSRVKREVWRRKCMLRSYNIVVTFNVNSKDNKFEKPLSGLMTTYGYTLPDPSLPNRLTVFFSGGILEPNQGTDLEQWKELFETEVTGKHMQQKAREVANKVLLGATFQESIAEDGAMSYRLNKPIGGHGDMYVDIIYMDESLRVMKGQTGSLYVLSRVPPQLIG